MANETTKPLSYRDANQTLQGAFNDVDKSLTSAGFLVGKIGHKVTRTDTSGGFLTGSQTGDDYTFYDSSLLLYTLRIIFTDSSKTIIVSAERVA